MSNRPELTKEEEDTLHVLKLEALRAFLEKHPMHITNIVHLSNEELNLPQHITRGSVDAWVREGVLQEERRKVREGPGRPRRIIGGLNTG